MAKVVQVQGIGGPEMLRVDDVEVPAPGKGEVRINVGAIGLNRVEVIYRQGGFGTLNPNSKIGFEAAGTIESVGEGVSDFKAGDRVAIIPGLPMDTYGTYGELILSRADMLVHTPDGQSDKEAAATWMQYLTAYAIMAGPRLGIGDYVVITAASSSVGLAAIQIANAVGAIPIAVTRTRDKYKQLKKLGAGIVIISDEQDVTEAIRTVTGGMGAHMVFDAVAGPGFVKLVSGLRRHGAAIVYGSLGGGMIELPTGLIMGNDITIRGSAANHLLAFPQKKKEAFEFIRKGIEKGTLAPVIDRSFPLSSIVEAHRHLESNTQIGKIIVTP